VGGVVTIITDIPWMTLYRSAVFQAIVEDLDINVGGQ
jgi:hypothetical protein